MRHVKVYCAAAAAACVLLCSQPAASQTTETVRVPSVLTIGNRQIGAEEFESRLNLYSIGYPHDPVLRKQFVALSLIQESLLAQSARESHLDTLEQVRTTIHEFEKEASYEEWMDREVRSKIIFSDQDVSLAYNLYRQQRIFDYEVFSDSIAAHNAERRFRRLPARTHSTRRDTLSQTKVLDYGEALRPVQEALFAMHEGDTRVMPADGKWYLFHLKSIMPHPTRAHQSFPQSYGAVAKLVRRQKELEIFESRMSALMRGRSFRLARNAREHLYGLLAARIPFSNPMIAKFPEMVNQEIAQRLPAPADLRETFLTFRDGGTMTLGQFWNTISTGPYLLNYQSPAQLHAGIDDLIRRAVIVETVVASAYRLGMDKAPSVSQQTAMWSDNLLSNLMQYHLSETHTPSESEILKEYNRRLALHRAEAIPGDFKPLAKVKDEIRQMVLQQKTHMAIDSVIDLRITRTTVSIDTVALNRTHALESDIVVRKEHFPNRYAVPRMIPANPEAAWAKTLMRYFEKP